MGNPLENLLEINFSNMNNQIKEDIKEDIKKKFLCSQKFSQDIEQLVKASKSNYIDAIVHYCEKNNIEIETISKLISKPLKEKLKNDAMQLNFLKKTTKAKLPL